MCPVYLRFPPAMNACSLSDRGNGNLADRGRNAIGNADMLGKLGIHRVEFLIAYLEMQMGRANPGVTGVGDDFPLADGELIRAAREVDGIALILSLFLLCTGVDGRCK